MKIVVLAGGLSDERNVSLVSGIEITQALRRKGHQAVLLDLFFGMEGVAWDAETVFEQLPTILERSIEAQAPNLEEIKDSRRSGGDALIGPGVLELCARADMVFLGLHGACGEDGRIQAMLDLHGIAYTGSGFLGSAIAMDKIQAKLVAEAAGVKTAAWSMLRAGETMPQIAFPCVAKIPDGGSSIGVAICQDEAELRLALTEFFKRRRMVLVEEYIPGREFSCGVLGEGALPAIEIIPKSGYFDYENKYQSGATQEICPADISVQAEATMRSAAMEMHRRLGLAVYSRSDFRMNEAGEIFYLETNTLPGMTPASLLPKEAAAAGIDYDSLCETIVAQSVAARKGD